MGRVRARCSTISIFSAIDDLAYLPPASRTSDQRRRIPASMLSPSGQEAIDPTGTILLPALLLFLHSPFLFGYAKPVPINFGALRNPKHDTVWVAAAGPGINIVLAGVSVMVFQRPGPSMR
jgi:hypothetical protein